MNNFSFEKEKEKGQGRSSKRANNGNRFYCWYFVASRNY